MRSIRTKAFKKLFARLPTHIQKQATADYEVFKRNPGYPGLCFKRIDPKRPLYSVRIGLDYRAVGIMENDVIRWYWIGSHEDYNKL
jgi:hypothetical protein